VTLIPAASIDPAEREGFEEHISSAQKLQHVNVGSVRDFGREGDDYVYVSERLAGETLASWVRSHGPMPADAALRVGEQIVSVLSSASFHKLPYPPIQASEIMLVPGQTAEGTWPLVKVTNFGLPAVMPQREPQLSESDVPGNPGVNDQQFSEPTDDIRAEIYSLGVTVYFLLTGIALSEEALQRGPKFSGFPKPLRILLGRLLHRDPDQRPKDLLVVTEMIRQSLGKIERRRTLSDRYGIPLNTSVPRPREARPRRLVRTAAVVGVLLLLAAAIAPVVFPDSIGQLVRGMQKPKEVGVLVGVPDSSPAASQQPLKSLETLRSHLPPLYHRNRRNQMPCLKLLCRQTPRRLLIRFTFRRPMFSRLK
jgi:serine/threonine protein kinase